jgi:hypothetical protein
MSGGTANPPKLYKIDLKRFGVPNSLLSLRNRMPRTIQDAMTLVAQLNLRYLWFDSLCLIQDDPVDLKRAITQMDVIFEAAWVTIIAAQGQSADSGLPGVSSFPRPPTQEIHQLKPGLNLLRVHSLDEHLNESAYSSRGWT